MGDSDLTIPAGVAARLEEVQILDVREQDEWDAGSIEGSVHIPLNSLMNGAMEGLESGRPVVVVCRSGSRSEVGRLMLMARGFEAYNLVGGLEAWAAEGRPLTSPTGSPGRVA